MKKPPKPRRRPSDPLGITQYETRNASPAFISAHPFLAMRKNSLTREHGARAEGPDRPLAQSRCSMREPRPASIGAEMTSASVMPAEGRTRVPVCPANYLCCGLPQQSLYAFPEPHGHLSFGFGIALPPMGIENGRPPVAARRFLCDTNEMESLPFKGV
jgi:hypothetical protein